nr:MAG TPA: hypothetical protein [Bacteriophage sp.]
MSFWISIFVPAHFITSFSAIKKKQLISASNTYFCI